MSRSRGVDVRLKTALGRNDLPEGLVGESFEVADTDEACSVVDGGPLHGASLRSLWGAPFPLLIKILDAREDLSVQLHPDGVEGGAVKEEAWVSLASGGAVATGAVDADHMPAPGDWLSTLHRSELQAGSRDGDVAPSLIHVPPGTVHAILAGSLVFEVQNPVNVTWRLDDYLRPGLDGQLRPLHIDRARPVLRRGPRAQGARDAKGRTLFGSRFAVALHAPRMPACPIGPVLFCRSGGVIHHGEAPPFHVPRGRTALSPLSASVQSPDWWVSCKALEELPEPA